MQASSKSFAMVMQSLCVRETWSTHVHIPAKKIARRKMCSILLGGHLLIISVRLLGRRCELANIELKIFRNLFVCMSMCLHSRWMWGENEHGRKMNAERRSTQEQICMQSNIKISWYICCIEKISWYKIMFYIHGNDRIKSKSH